MGQYNFVSPGAMAAKSIEEFLLQQALLERQAEQDAIKEQERQRQAQMETQALNLRREELGVRQKNEVADQNFRDREFEQRSQRQAKLDDIAAADLRQQANRAGVRQMAMEGLGSGAATPAIIQRMFYGETGETLPADIIDPGRAERVDERNFEQQKELARLQGEESRKTVAANRAAQPPQFDSGDAEAVTRNALEQAKRLKSMPGIDTATGAYELRGFTQDAVDFNSVRNQLVAALALPNLGALKGPMSDKDILFVKQLATRLENPRLSRPETERAIDEAIAFLSSKVAVGAPEAPQGPAPGTRRVINGVPAVWDGRGWKRAQ